MRFLIPVFITVTACSSIVGQTVQDAVRQNAAFFDSKENYSMSGCSEETWALMRRENDFVIRREDGPQATARHVNDMEDSLSECERLARNAAGETFDAIYSMLKMQKQGGDFVDLILSQMRNLLVLQRIEQLASEASHKVLLDYLFERQRN